MKLLVDNTFIVAPLKCGTRSIRLFIALAKNTDLLKNYQNQKDFIKNIKLDSKFSYKIEPAEYPDLENVLNYNKKFESMLDYHDYIDYKKITIACNFKLGFIRDPVERFISSYNMMCKNFLGQYPIQDFLKKFHELMWTSNYYRHHFKPQTQELGLNPNWYTKIIDIKQMSLFKEHLQREYNCVLPDIHINKTAGHVFLKHNELTQDQINWIKELYSIDYQIYGNYLKN